MTDDGSVEDYEISEAPDVLGVGADFRKVDSKFSTEKVRNIPLLLAIFSLIVGVVSLRLAIDARNIAKTEVTARIEAEKSGVAVGVKNLYEPPADLEKFIENIARSVALVHCGDSSGSGWSYELDISEGYLGNVITNHHVIKDCIDHPENLYIEYESVPGKGLVDFDAAIYNYDEENDLALLDVKVAIPKLVPADYFARPGQWSMTIGFPAGMEKLLLNAVTIGNIVDVEDKYYVFTTAIVNPGNSGGPLVDSAGNVIGTNSYSWASTKDGVANVAVDTDILCKSILKC